MPDFTIHLGMRQPKRDGQGIKRETIQLWPEAGRRLGLGKSGTYEAAHRGDIPVIRMGGRFLVLREPFERMLRGETLQPAIGSHLQIQA